jgi:UDP-N-acetyl-D-galactosamine dehydrogenase
VVNEFVSFGVSVEVVDPHASSEELMEEYGFGLVEGPSGKYDAIVVAVNHKEYTGLDESFFTGHAKENCVLVDLKGMYRDKIKNISYWSL